MSDKIVWACKDRLFFKCRARLYQTLDQKKLMVMQGTHTHASKLGKESLNSIFIAWNLTIQFIDRRGYGELTEEVRKFNEMHQSQDNAASSSKTSRKSKSTSNRIESVMIDEHSISNSSDEPLITKIELA